MITPNPADSNSDVEKDFGYDGVLFYLWFNMILHNNTERIKQAAAESVK